MNIEYPLNTDKSNLAKIILNERYPTEGYVTNTISEMTVYILKGEITLMCDNKEQKLSEGSVVLIKPDQEYYWEPYTETTLLIFSTPPWIKEQQIQK